MRAMAACAALIAACAGPATPAQTVEGLGVLCVGPEAASDGEAAARSLGGQVLGGCAVQFTPDGRLTTADDSIDAESLRVLWWHSETSPPAPEMLTPAALRSLLEWLQAGHGLFLSGTALAYVQALGLEPVTPRVAGGGSDSFVPGLLPSAAAVAHPIFDGLPVSEPILLSSAGWPAFADFYGTGGPLGGVVIAEAAPDGGERPLVEYACGKGRIITMGWRLPHYGLADNAHRDNLERLTGNILRYLAGGKWFGRVGDTEEAEEEPARIWLVPCVDLSMQDDVEAAWAQIAQTLRGRPALRISCLGGQRLAQLVQQRHELRAEVREWVAEQRLEPILSLPDRASPDAALDGHYQVALWTEAFGQPPAVIYMAVGKGGFLARRSDFWASVRELGPDCVLLYPAPTNEAALPRTKLSARLIRLPLGTAADPEAAQLFADSRDLAAQFAALEVLTEGAVTLAPHEVLSPLWCDIHHLPCRLPTIVEQWNRAHPARPARIATFGQYCRAGAQAGTVGD